jgi:hypothetical protein
MYRTYNTRIMGAKHSTTISNDDEVKDDIPVSSASNARLVHSNPGLPLEERPSWSTLSTNEVSKGTKNEECLQPKTIEFGDSSGNITVILQYPIHASGKGDEIHQPSGKGDEILQPSGKGDEILQPSGKGDEILQPTNSSENGTRLAPIVDKAGCGCMDVYMRSETNASTIVKCNCSSQCMCVPPCECESSKTPTIASAPVKSPWVVPHIFTKTSDLEKRLDDIENQFNKIKESLNNHGKRIETLETISKQMTEEYVPLSAIPFCTHCKTIVLNGQVCDCGLIVP